MYRRLHEPTMTLFDPPRSGTQPSPPEPKTKGFTLPWILFPIYLPLLIIAAGLSFPVGAVQRRIVQRRERRLAAQLRSASRTISAEKATDLIGENRGTLVWETLSHKGPWRLWWTSDDIAAASPFPFYRSSDGKSRSFYEEEFRAFGRWFAENYAHPTAGKALLVDVADENTKSLLAQVKDLDLITTLTPPTKKA